MTPREALGRFLAALGVRPERVPADVDEAAALFRSLVSGRRLLVLLDDANHPDQVRPLLPGDARCTVVVTSRDRLDGLVARDGAARLALDGLRPDDARQLLARMLGAERAGAEPAALDELARLCRHRPLALRLAGAHLSARPHVTVAGYTDRFARPDGARLARAGTGAGVSTRTGSSWTA